MNESLWHATTKMPAFPALHNDAKTDVLVIGGGMAGLLCAWELKQAGVDCLLIEAERICRGTTGCTTAKLTAQHGLIYAKLLRRFGAEKARLYWQANQEALARYRSLCQSISCDFETKASYIYSCNAPEKLEEELEALSKLGIPAEFVSDLPLPLRTAGAIRFAEQAQFHPLKFAAAIARGLNIREHTRAVAFHGNTVLTRQGKIRAEKIIVATHFPMLNKHGGYFAKLYQHRSYLLALENAPELQGMYMDEAKTGLSFRNHDGLLLLGGEAHRTGKQGGGWRPLSEFAAQHYPQAKEVVRWAAQDCMSLDDVPYVGQYSPRTPNLYVAAGFNKWGMTSAMAAARLLCDLVQGRQNPAAALFAPDRSILRPQLAINLTESTLNLLTPTVPRCPHLGCALKYNPQEHSWDCPCHGSRFSQQGELLNNPANADKQGKLPPRP